MLPFKRSRIMPREKVVLLVEGLINYSEASIINSTSLKLQIVCNRAGDMRDPKYFSNSDTDVQPFEKR